MDQLVAIFGRDILAHSDLKSQEKMILTYRFSSQPAATQNPLCPARAGCRLPFVPEMTP
ncbi:hypothetical protein [Gemmobacter denitrificans]|uniref:Uncharacterized protein n=1 Tax=Gemmobacter denitrificans TaxID=3123040 RepID=A0ABU8BR91_9RHOB